MRPKVVQRPWQGRAIQLSFYTLWPLLLLWVLYSYPGGSSSDVRTTEVVYSTTRDKTHTLRVTSDPSLTSAALTAGTTAELSNVDSSAWQLPPKKGGGSIGSSSSSSSTSSAANSVLDAASGSSSSDGLNLEQVGTIGSSGADASGRVYSSATVYVVRNGNGNLAKYYYKFHNVKLTRKVLYFFMPPGMPKPEENWVDFVSGNSTTPGLPTMIVIKGEVQRQKWFYLPIRYTYTPSTCITWTSKPTYFLQVRYSYNIWHTWDEGLMGVFQTLREQGMLPLVQVDAEGNMREVTEGLSPQCPTIWDGPANTTRPEDNCVQRIGVVRETKCDTKNQPWCRPGVVSYHRFDGPIILPYTAASVMNRWAQVYDAMTTDVRDFSLVDGHCFKNFIVGKTNTLNFYQAVNFSSPVQDHIQERIDAMSVFKEFVSTAQREFVAAERQKNPEAVEFRGYVNPKMERLRQGLGPEDISLVDYIAPSEVPGLLREELPQLKEMWAKRRKEIAKIEAAWKAGKSVVDVSTEDDDDDAPGGSSSGDASSSSSSSAGDAAASSKGGSSTGKGSSSNSGGGSKADKAAEASRRSLLEPELAGSSSGSSGGSDELAAPTGEGARRRLPQRGLLQADGGDEDGEEEEEVEYEDEGGDDDGEVLDYTDLSDDDEEEQQAGGSSSSQAAGVAAALSSGSSKAQRLGLEQEAVEAAKVAAEREAVLKAMPPILKHSADYTLEKPRPVVTYMSRNFFSRGVLNEHDILRYILSKYNVTLRVTTFEEPLLEAMELLQHTDVLIGMHGAGWTNGMFIKHSAVTLQMFPYGWRLPDNSTIRGYNYREIVLASECKYIEWVNQRWDYAFFRRIDFNRRVKMEYVLHPDPNGPHPIDGWPGNPWIYQNTYVDMAHFGPYIDRAMEMAGIKPVANPIPVSLN